MTDEKDNQIDFLQHEVSRLRECRDQWKAQAESLADRNEHGKDWAAIGKRAMKSLPIYEEALRDIVDLGNKSEAYKIARIALEMAKQSHSPSSPMNSSEQEVGAT